MIVIHGSYFLNWLICLKKMIINGHVCSWLPVVPHKAVAEVSKVGNL